jgi:very-short-patch-repair endonuclease
MTSSKRAEADKLDKLRQEIALAIGIKKSYQVPAFCVKLRLQETATKEDEDLAFRSKRLYVLPMIESKSEPELLDLAQRVLKDVDYEPLELLFTELTQHSEHRVSKLVRKDVLHALNAVERLFGDQPVLDTLERVLGAQAVAGEAFARMLGPAAGGPITQHYLRNNDWSHQQMLEHCGVLDCPQTTFFRLIDAVLDPMVRRDKEQSELAEAISRCLQRDGFAVKATAWQSGYTVFGVVRAAPGVSGSMKNLIFASTGAKPELVFRDAVNNDVEIVKNADKVLVFDQPLPSGLLSWAQLQAWWADTMKLADEEEAKRTLFLRLQQSVKETGSPGEFLLFRTYYEHFGRLDPMHRPALLPQVYLHYDPYTRRERGLEQVLARQRMDFLLLLASGVRVVVEIDGQHHYGDAESDGRYRASAVKYAAMAAEDRRLRLSGYEVYRFGAAELLFDGAERAHQEVTAMIVAFFNGLFRRHGLATVD